MLDNASVHKAKKLNGIRKRYWFLFVPPYRPQFNMIETIFFHQKRKFRQLNSLREMALEDAFHQSVISTSSEQLCQAYLTFLRYARDRAKNIQNLSNYL